MGYGVDMRPRWGPVQGRSFVCLALVWYLGALLTGCAGPSAALPRVPVEVVDGVSSIQINADWDDVDAAMIVAAQHVEATVTRASEVSPTHRRYVVTHVSGEVGEVNVTRADAARDEQVDLRAMCRIGRIHEPERDRALLQALAARLTALRGVEFAPLPD